jgi:circadian clock protein KaiC
MSDEERTSSQVLHSGIRGLDEILGGGLTRNRLHLIEGDPGSGKTTLSLQILFDGVRRGERCMFVTLSETADELRAGARSHGWSLEGIDVIEVLESDEQLKPDGRYTMYRPSEVELGETTKAVLAEVQRIKPSRLVIDSLSEFRLLAENSLRYRRQVLALKQHFARQGCTVFFIDDRTGSEDKHLHSLAHGVISLDRHTAEYGNIRRRLQISKMRGQAFREGYHDYIIRRGGVEVFPRLVAAEHRAAHEGPAVESGLTSLDALLGGGLALGTSTLMIGAAGTGKSSLAAQYAKRAVERGEHAALFLFDESIATFTARSAGLGIDVRKYLDSGQINLRQVDPAELSPGEFAYALRETVDQNKSSIVVIDSLNGYLNAMPSDRFLTLHLHELLSNLGHRGVTTLMTMTQHGIVGGTAVPLDLSYIADTVILLRYFEAFGEVRQAISVIKKRTGKHERTVREMRIDNGLAVGEPLREFRAVLSGMPEFVGPAAKGLEGGHESRTSK